MRRTSPCTRIMGGSPADKCRSDALFLTTKASSSVRSITILPAAREIPAVFQGIMATISDNLQVVRERIARAARAAGRDPVSVTLLAVSKSQPVARVEEARATGWPFDTANNVTETGSRPAAR